ncbi:LPXTG cell wall anchor domain-containing protein [Streptomyces sp. NPDC051597]|uniref:LPXTG cell wall anchor domain-containing protein n=1 Tax=Streptomyces sp. NPDC051597 TaxID=3155049 RepID=UPI0034381C7E
MNTTKHHGRTFARGAAAAGLLAALAVPALAGTAHADGGTQPRHLATTRPAPASAAPTVAPSTSPQRPAPATTPASPSLRPTAAPSTPPSAPEPAPPTKTPSESRPGTEPSAAPSPSTRQDELAHTGSSKTNTVLGAGAGALIAAGAGTVYAVRRRQNH